MSASLRERSEQCIRSEGICFSFPSDDEVGGLQSAIRSERSEQSNIA
jgi:hypothetical protein